MRSLLLGPIVDRIGETWAMRLGTVLLVLGLALYPLPRDLWTLALVIPLVPIGTALLFPATTSLMSRHSDPGELGTTMGVAQTFAGLARVHGPDAGHDHIPAAGSWLAVLRRGRVRGAGRDHGVPGGRAPQSR